MLPARSRLSAKPSLEFLCNSLAEIQSPHVTTCTDIPRENDYSLARQEIGSRMSPSGENAVSPSTGPRRVCRGMTAKEIRGVAKNLLLLLALLVLPIYIARPSLELQKGTDFPEFYAAAKIVSAGRGHELYLNRTQDEFQVRYFGGVGTYFNHPPFEILLYLPFAFLPPQYARWL